MSVHIITESSSDISPAEAAKYGIDVIPMSVSFGDKTYSDGVDLNHEDFYHKLIESDVVPVTSMIPPMEYTRIFRRIALAGDSAVVISLSSNLSGTCQSAMLAAQDYAECIHVVDSRAVCLGQRILALRAVELRDAGRTAEEIAQTIEAEKSRVRLIAVLDTLEYLKKGGRISAATAFAGTLLGIKPVVSVEKGEVIVVGKARGSRNANNQLRKLVEDCGIDFTRPLCLGYTGLSDIMVKKYAEDSRDLWDGASEEMPVVSVGAVIGTHAGPGAVAACFFAKKHGNGLEDQ